MSLITIELGQYGNRQSRSFRRILIDQIATQPDHIWKQQPSSNQGFTTYTLNLPVKTIHAIRVTESNREILYRIQILGQKSQNHELLLLSEPDIKVTGHFKLIEKRNAQPD